MHKKEKDSLLNTSNLVAFVSLAIAILSLIVAITNTNLMIKMARVYSELQIPENSNANTQIEIEY